MCRKLGLFCDSTCMMVVLCLVKYCDVIGLVVFELNLMIVVFFYEWFVVLVLWSVGCVGQVGSVFWCAGFDGLIGVILLFGEWMVMKCVGNFLMLLICLKNLWVLS